MIQTNTILTVIDNSGAKTVSCIKVSKGFRRRYARIGDLITVSIKTLRPKRRLATSIIKGDICLALILRDKKPTQRFNGGSFKFLENSVVLLSKQKKFLFTRIFGVVPSFVRHSRYLRVATMAAGLLK